LLLSASGYYSNTRQQWKEDGQTLAEWGHGPVIIEPVTGTITLDHLNEVKSAHVQALSATGKSMNAAVPVTMTKTGCQITVGDPATTWYLIELKR
jgi:hypothetical protein